MCISWKKWIQEKGLIFMMSLIFVCMVFGTELKVNAEGNVEVIPVSGTFYASTEASVFAEPNNLTLVTTVPKNTALTITGQTSVGYFEVSINNTKYYILASQLSLDKVVDDNTRINAAAALVGNALTGEIYFNQDALVRRAPASTTKVMTALLVYEAIERGELTLDTPVAVSAASMAGMPSDASHVTPRLKAGEIMTIESLLNAVMLKSDCVACNVLAEAVAGSVDKFVALMNQRATELGCTDTNFVNTHGYPNANHYTNAYSLFLIAREAVNYQSFVSIVRQQQSVIPQTNLTNQRTLNTTDELLKPSSKYYNKYAFGLKTGSAKSSGLCMIGGAAKDGRVVISVVLGAEKVNENGTVKNNQFYETNRLLNAGLAF